MADADQLKIYQWLQNSFSDTDNQHMTNEHDKHN